MSETKTPTFKTKTLIIEPQESSDQDKSLKNSKSPCIHISDVVSDCRS